MSYIPRNRAQFLHAIGDSILLPRIGVHFVSHYAFSSSGAKAYYCCYDRKTNSHISSDTPVPYRAVLTEKYIHRLTPANDLNPF